MENNNLILRISRLLSSSFGSCRLRVIPDVADSSISMQTQTHNHNNLTIPFGNDDTSPFINIHPEKTLAANRSSSSHSGWFSSADDDKFPENEAFFSFSSFSGESFRLRDRRRPKVIRSDHETKSTDECKKMTMMAGSSRRMAEPPTPQITREDVTKTHEKKKKKKNGKAVAAGSDDELIMSAKIYYSSCSSGTGRSRRRSRRSLGEYSYVAVEKKSRDPRRDFEASMVEMMMAKEVLGAEDLETLLISFLSLNSVCYHSIILQVFSDICQSLLTF